MSFLLPAVFVILTIPYLAWGVYALRIKYRYHEEFSPATEAITLTAVTIFFVVELSLLRAWMLDTPLMFVFTVLGLLVSGAALYGSMLVSLASQLLVDFFIPARHDEVHAPNFVPVEALERVGDYDGALQECLVIAQIFPKDPDTLLRVAQNMTELDRYEESTQWFEAALALMNDPTKSLRVSNRLAEIYNHRLERTGDARRVLEEYLANHPDSERAETVKKRIARLSESAEARAVSPTAPPGVPLASPAPTRETPSE
ncbi:MAG: hypothetical protein QGG73_09840 [Candidatus Hydrogenedentes bacterium]|jgi:tetratricopeptide (TPR) repeat protein|nr:hypothetical protein [Candidatus Hydrogenedentota bacterium]